MGDAFAVVFGEGADEAGALEVAEDYVQEVAGVGLLVFVVFEAEAGVGFGEVVVVCLFAVVFEAVDVHAQEDGAGDAVDFGG